MRLREWIEKYGYSGRGMAVPEHTIIWYFMEQPVKAGLIWMSVDGVVHLNDKTYSKIVPSSTDRNATHKKMLAFFYDKLELNKHMTGNAWQDVEELLEMNPRGRIIDDEINIYDNPYGNTKDADSRAIKAIKKYIDEFWYDTGEFSQSKILNVKKGRLYKLIDKYGESKGLYDGHQLLKMSNWSFKYTAVEV